MVSLRSFTIKNAPLHWPTDHGVKSLMSDRVCEHCREVNQEFRIRSPRDLERAIKVVADNLKDGTIRESAYWPPGILNCCDSGAFSELAKGRPWGDIVDYYFECPECNQLYHLSAETYHGSGGSWCPAERE